MKRRLLMTTTAYPPSMGGAQEHIAELRARLEHFDADVATLWSRQRTDWLLGTTIRLREPEVAELGRGVRALGWSASARARMGPWVAAYYAWPTMASERIARQMIPFVELAVDAEHVLIHNHRIGREFLAQASLAVAHRRGLPFVLTPHHHPKWRGRRYRGWTDVYRAADAVLAHTKAELNELVSLGVAEEKLHVISGSADEAIPADPARFRAKTSCGDTPIILFLGQMLQYKGIAELAAAVDVLQAQGLPCQAVFIGPPTRFSERYFAKHSRPWLHVLGLVDRQTKWDAIEAATVVCLPSRHEAFGRVYLEGWSKAKPVIGARIPAVSEVVTDGKTGLLVDPGSVEQLARALERLLKNPELASRLGREGRREVIDGRFSWAEVVRRVESVYAEVLADTTARRQRGDGHAHSLS